METLNDRETHRFKDVSTLLNQLTAINKKLTLMKNDITEDTSETNTNNKKTGKAI